MTGWNYPPGVSGLEREIAGADEEWEESLWCNECYRVSLFHCEKYHSDFSAVCTVCDCEHPSWSEDREIWEDNLNNDPEPEEVEGLLVEEC